MVSYLWLNQPNTLSWCRSPLLEMSRFHHYGKFPWWGRWHKPPSFVPGCHVWCTSCRNKQEHTTRMKTHFLKGRIVHGQSCLHFTLYLQSILLSAAYFSGLKSFAVITIEKWVTLKERETGNKRIRKAVLSLSLVGGLNREQRLCTLFSAVGSCTSTVVM